MLQNNNLSLNNILIVDDEINVCMGCQRIFDEQGFKSNYALSGMEGLKKAESEDFNLVITDMKMPDISGLEMIKRLKQMKPDVAVVMITGYASVQSAVEAMKYGAVDYIPKPFRPDEILTVVHEAIKRNSRISSDTQESGEIKEANGNKKIIEKKHVLAVLTRMNKDMKFWRTLWEKGSCVLNCYSLTSEAKAAIVSGDINWIKNNYAWNEGELTEEKLSSVRHFLEMERW
ncbi:MAG: response regulator [Desulfobacteraceae bacterium]|jgi:DNA-binding NtrC family response regulator